MFILLGILKVLSFILIGILVILSILLFLLLVILFSPIHYYAEVKGDSENHITGLGKVRYIGYVLHISMKFDKTTYVGILRLFGIPIKRFTNQVFNEPARDKTDRLKPVEPSQNKEKVLQSRAVPLKTVVPEKSLDKPKEDLDKQAKVLPKPLVKDSEPILKTHEIIHEKTLKREEAIVIPPIKQKEPIKKDTKTKSKSQPQKDKTKKKPFIERVQLKITQIKSKWNEFNELVKTHELKAYGKKVFGILWGILKHIRPRKFQVKAEFGLGDPAETAFAFGIYSMIYPKLSKISRCKPNFHDKMFKGEILIKGRIILFVILFPLVKLYFNKTTKWLIQQSTQMKKSTK